MSVQRLTATHPAAADVLWRVLIGGEMLDPTSLELLAEKVPEVQGLLDEYGHASSGEQLSWGGVDYALTAVADYVAWLECCGNCENLSVSQDEDFPANDWTPPDEYGVQHCVECGCAKDGGHHAACCSSIATDSPALEAYRQSVRVRAEISDDVLVGASLADAALAEQIAAREQAEDKATALDACWDDMVTTQTERAQQAERAMDNLAMKLTQAEAEVKRLRSAAQGMARDLLYVNVWDEGGWDAQGVIDTYDDGHMALATPSSGAKALVAEREGRLSKDNDHVRAANRDLIVENATLRRMLAVAWDTEMSERRQSARIPMKDWLADLRARAEGGV